MELRAVILDTLALAICMLFGVGIRRMVEILWDPKVGPFVWIGSAALSTTYGFFGTFLQSRVTYEQSRNLMAICFLLAFTFSSRRVPVAALRNDGIHKYVHLARGILFTFPFVWLGVCCARALH